MSSLCQFLMGPFNTYVIRDANSGSSMSALVTPNVLTPNVFKIYSIKMCFELFIESTPDNEDNLAFLGSRPTY